MKKNIEISPNIETLFGTRDENLHVLEDGLNITIDLRSDSIELEGAARDVARAEQLFSDYDNLQRSGYTFNNGDLNSMLRVLVADPKASLRGLAEAGKQRSFGGRRTVQPKSVNQRRYLESIEKHDMVFGIGPAGTGKTYLAVAMAISALLAKRVNRIILARPAVEAGERLGFLPGTLQEKIDPYLRPLYDALYDIIWCRASSRPMTNIRCALKSRCHSWILRRMRMAPTVELVPPKTPTMARFPRWRLES